MEGNSIDGFRGEGTMSYHDLSECTLTEDERVAEKDRICKMLEDVLESQFSRPEYDFVTKMHDSPWVSVKQLFWLRDIKDRVL